MIFWIVLYSLAGLLVVTWACLFTRNRRELKRLVTWPAILCSSISAGMGIWGQIHIHELWRRSYFDFEFERRAFDFAAVGLIAALIWLIRSRNITLWLALAASLGMAMVWAAALMTL